MNQVRETLVGLFVAASAIGVPSSATAANSPGDTIGGIGVIAVTNCTSDTDYYGFVDEDGNYGAGDPDRPMFTSQVFALDDSKQRIGVVEETMDHALGRDIVRVDPSEYPGYAGIEAVIETDDADGSVIVAPADGTCPTEVETAEAALGDQRWEPSVEPITPDRVFDSRELADGAPLAAGSFTPIDLSALPEGTTSVIANVTATGAAGQGHLSTCMVGQEHPPSRSFLNYRPGEAIANQTVLDLDLNAHGCIYTHAQAHVIVDVTAVIAGIDFFEFKSDPSQDPLSPLMIDRHPPLFDVDAQPGDRYDTRALPAPDGRLTAGETRSVEIASPRSGTAWLTLTAVRPEAAGHLDAFACVDGASETSDLNYAAGDVRAATVTVRVPADGEICVTSSAATDLIIDSVATSSNGELTTPAGARLADTRPDGSTVDGVSAGEGVLAAGEVLEVQVAGRGDVAEDARAAQLNLTIAAPTADGHAVAYPCDADLPLSSTVNFTSGHHAANHSFVELSPTGTVCVWSLVDTHVVVDVEGFVADRPTITTVSSGDCDYEFDDHFSSPIQVYGGVAPYDVEVTSPTPVEVSIGDDGIAWTTPDEYGRWPIEITITDQNDIVASTTATVGSLPYIKVPATC